MANLETNRVKATKPVPQPPVRKLELQKNGTMAYPEDVGKTGSQIIPYLEELNIISQIPTLANPADVLRENFSSFNEGTRRLLAKACIAKAGTMKTIFALTDPTQEDYTVPSVTHWNRDSKLSLNQYILTLP